MTKPKMNLNFRHVWHYTRETAQIRWRYTACGKPLANKKFDIDPELTTCEACKSTDEWKEAMAFVERLQKKGVMA